MTFGAGTERIIEREQPRFYFFDADAAIGAGILSRKKSGRAVYDFHRDQSVGEFYRRLYTVAKPLAYAFFYNKPVYYRAHVVLNVFFKGNFFVERINYSVDFHSSVSAFL